MKRRLANTIGFDDAPFPPHHRGNVPVVGAVCAGTRLDGVLTGRVRRDGANASRQLAHLVATSRFAEHAQLVLLQGLTLAGFNVVDIRDLHRRLGLPVLVVVRKRPDLAAIRKALLQRVPGGTRKWRLIESLEPPRQVGPVFVQTVGLSLEEASAAVAHLILHGHIPEPLRLAHLIAGALARGESSGRV